MASRLPGSSHACLARPQDRNRAERDRDDNERNARGRRAERKISGVVTVVVSACNSIGSVLRSPIAWLDARSRPRTT